MDKSEIIQLIDQNLKALLTSVTNVPTDKFFRRPDNGKWSIAQNVRHLHLAVRPLNLAFSMPAFMFIVFGSPGRSSVDYNTLVERYQSRLKAGAKASLPYVPRDQTGDKAQMIAGCSDAYRSLLNKLASVDDATLDKYFLPHPILGRITMREMLYFTAYHVGHHHKTIEERIRG